MHSAPIVIDETVYFVGSEAVYAYSRGGEQVDWLDFADIAERYQEDYTWQLVTSPETPADGAFIYVSDNSLWSVSIADGSVNWETSASTSTGPVRAGDHAYVGGDDGLQAFDVASGELQWRAVTDSKVTGGLAVADVYCATDQDRIHAIE